MKQCFGYIRVSTAKQGEGVSLTAQKEAIQAFADREGFTVTRWFEEKETAAKRGRPVFMAMVKELRKGAAQGLIIHKIDRSARNFTDWAKIGDLADAGVDIHFATESLDFRSRGGRLTADIQAVIAADYIRNLREETIKGIEGRLKQGLYPFKAPIGYLDNGGGKAKTPDPIRAPHIKAAFTLYASGQHSLRSLMQELERRGLRNDQGKPLSKCGLETILNNPFYCGLIRIKRTGATYQGIHEPLIPMSLFEAVQAVKSGKSGPKVTRHNHTYRGLFRCQDCDAPMIPERQKAIYVYYRCQNPACPTKTVREETIEAAIQRLLERTRLKDEDAEQLQQEFQMWLEGRTNRSHNLTIAKQIASLEAKLERLTDALIDRLIDETTYQERKGKLTFELAKLEEAKANTENATPSMSQVQKFLELLKSLADTYRNAEAPEKREITAIATSNRYVSGRNVLLEPANWLLAAEQAVAGLCGAPDRDRDRTFTTIIDGHQEALKKAAERMISDKRGGHL